MIKISYQPKKYNYRYATHASIVCPVRDKEKHINRIKAKGLRILKIENIGDKND